MGASQAKRFVGWGGVASSKPQNPRDPADPAYEFTELDRFVRAASGRGLQILLGVQGAPAWAVGDGAPSSAPPGTWKPDPGALGAFMAALARRYSGSFPDPEGGSLPKVRDFQIWNEPNLSTYLTPQWNGNRPVGARHYKKMLNASSRAIKSVDRRARVVTGGLAPYGEPPGGSRTRPLRFWREVFCLKTPKLKRKKRCGDKARFDVFAHHPINTSGPPKQGAVHPDDASSGDLPSVRRVLRAAERQRTVQGKGKHPLWATEMWWESDPPSDRGYPLRKQARFIQETMYLAWRAGFSTVIQLRIRDSPPSPSIGGRTADGLYFINGDPKPSAKAFRFPFVADRKNKRRVKLWGKAPAKGAVKIERKNGKRWKRLVTLRAGGNRVFKGKLGLRGRKKLRARFGGETSMTWRVTR